MSDAPETEETTTEESTIPKFTVGYFVGLSEDGKFVFEPVGDDMGFIELLGIHKYAEFRVNRIIDQQQTSGDALIDAVGQSIALAHQKLDQLIEKTKEEDKSE